MAKKLFDYVHEILSEKESVIVPDFGAFVVQKTTTFLNDAEYISIIFSAQQQHDDGVLSEHIARTENKSNEDIEEFITTELEQIFEEINDKGIFNVEGIGEFRAINERIVFKPFDEQFIKKSNTSAPVSIVTPIEEPKMPEPILPKEEPKIESTFITPTPATEVKEKVEEYNPTKNIPKKKADEPNLKVPLLIILVVVLLGATYYFFQDELANLSKPTITNDTTQIISDENLQQLSDTLNEVNAAMSDGNTIDSVTTEQSPVASVSNNTEPVETNNIPKANDVILKGNVSELTYYVTGGSYSSKKDAELEKQNLDYTGFVAKIIETNTGKKYHVVVAEFNNEVKAREELSFAKTIDSKFYLTTVKPNDK